MRKSSIPGRCVSFAVLSVLLVLGLTEGQTGEAVPNLALGKETLQSSISAGGESDRAVDGNTSGNWRENSCTHTGREDLPWWSVDLGQSTRVTDVVVYNRVDCCGDRLADFDVIVSNSQSPSDEEGTLCAHFDGVAGGKVSLKCPLFTEGRYLIVTMPGTEPLTLCEVEVYNKGEAVPNLALGKETLQSSISAGGESDRAVDGNTSGNWRENSCTHTGREDLPWWSVDLGQSTRVTDVVVYNRVDCCGDRLADFDVILSYSQSPPDEEGTLCAHFVGVAGEKVSLQCGQFTEGRYLIVKMPGTEPLTLCEVEVFNRGGPGPNLALGKTTVQSSISAGGESGRAVDGNQNGIYNALSCTHTGSEDLPWWSVDLRQSTRVTDVIVYNRVDCCGDRLADFDVIVSNRPSPSDQAGTLCAHFDGAAGEQVSLKCPLFTEGRFLIVTMPGTEPLTLCEVEVYNRGPGPNLALGKGTVQSSTSAGGESGRAVDGNTSGDYGANSCTHTGNEFLPWWSVSLGQNTQVTDVIVYNRVDCCGDRLADFDVIVSNSLFPSTEEETLCAHFDGAAGEKVILQCGQFTEGRFLIVKMPGIEPLTLCEVEVYNRG